VALFLKGFILVLGKKYPWAIGTSELKMEMTVMLNLSKNIGILQFYELLKF